MRGCILLLGFVSTLFAEAGSYGKVTLETLESSGLVKLNGTTIVNDLHVNGSLISQDSEIGTLDVLGEANLTRTIVKNGGAVMGSFQATRSKVEKPIAILSHRAVFTNCQLAGITVKQDAAFKGKQVVELKQSTLVDGPIHFESGKGEVIIYGGSQVLGSVTGGKVLKKL